MKIFNRTVPAMVLALIVLAGLGSAGLLAYHGMVTGTVTVEQSVKLDGYAWDYTNTYDALTVAGNTVTSSHSLTNDAEVPATLKFETSCIPDCDGITITNMVGLSVIGFPSTADPFESDYYKASDYDSPVSDLDDLETITYSFEITERDGFGDTSAPYIVIVGDGIGNYNVAVYMIPDGNSHEIDEEYVRTIDDTSLFHVPGSTVCTQQSPCTLSEVKTEYPTATISKIRLALGAWPGEGSSISISMGIGTINGQQAQHKSLTIYGGSTVPTVEKYDFAINLVPGIYTITTSVVPVA